MSTDEIEKARLGRKPFGGENRLPIGATVSTASEATLARWRDALGVSLGLTLDAVVAFANKRGFEKTLATQSPATGRTGRKK